MFDLSVDYFNGMPNLDDWCHPSYQIGFTHTPVGSAIDGSTGVDAATHRVYSYCSDSFSMLTHNGTHIDTLVHMGYHGRMWNGWNVDEHLGSRSWLVGGADKYPPIIARGVLLDIAGLHGVDRLPADHVIRPKQLVEAARKQKVELKPRDAVFIRTGWMSLWPESTFQAIPLTGIDLASAQYLCESTGAMLVGTDTPALEVYPSVDPGFCPVHCYMFATAGTPIVEVVQLDELAEEGVYDFVFIGMPMPLSGATGAPMRPLAIRIR